ncbi:hypothetical protein ACJMK2_021933, partial [Sinanodonta woodiana]
MSKTNLSVYETYSTYITSVNTSLTKYFQKYLGEEFVSVEIQQLSIDSLKVKYLLVTHDSVAAKSSIAKYVLQAYNETFLINGKNTTILAIESNGQNISKSMEQCEVHAIFNQPCQPDYNCSVGVNDTVCRPRTKDNFDLVIGLGVGIPLSILLVLIIIFLVIHFRRRAAKQNSSDGSSFFERYRDSAHGYLPPEMLPNIWSGQVHSGTFCPSYQWDSESATSSDSFRHDRRTSMTPSYRSTFGNSHQEAVEGYGRHQISNSTWHMNFENMNPNER